MTDVPAGELFLGETIDDEHERTDEPVLVKAVDTLDVPLERSDIRITALSLVWIPVG